MNQVVYYFTAVRTYLFDVTPCETFQFGGDGREVNARVDPVLRHGHFENLLPRLAQNETKRRPQQVSNRLAKG